MKLITANKLNRFWKNGILPALGLKVDSSKVLKTKEEVTANTNPDNIPSAVVVDELIDNLGGYKRKPILLWENTGNLSSFAAQTVQLLSDDYDYLEIIHTGYSAEYRYVNKVIKGFDSALYSVVSVTSTYLVSRVVSFLDNTHIAFADAKTISNNTTLNFTNNAVAVPVKIYGHKY